MPFGSEKRVWARMNSYTRRNHGSFSVLKKNTSLSTMVFVAGWYRNTSSMIAFPLYGIPSRSLASSSGSGSVSIPVKVWLSKRGLPRCIGTPYTFRSGKRSSISEMYLPWHTAAINRYLGTPKAFIWFHTDSGTPPTVLNRARFPLERRRIIRFCEQENRSFGNSEKLYVVWTIHMVPSTTSLRTGEAYASAHSASEGTTGEVGSSWRALLKALSASASSIFSMAIASNTYPIGCFGAFSIIFKAASLRTLGPFSVM
mmetsp:Transcript_25894/g.42537  ORF Transcript_25894/g.42537 Transcript_25894/m.42537 type:complete len:257 (+) Transcript_25894:606-1376(+)